MFMEEPKECGCHKAIRTPFPGIFKDVVEVTHG